MNFKNPSKMNESQARECIIHKLPKIYKSETGKKFIHHLVNAFSQGGLKYITHKETESSQYLDCVTNRILEPVYDHKPDSTEIKNIKENIRFNSPLKSPNSDKILGKVEFDCLQEWIKQEIESGNEEIDKIVKYNRRKTAQAKKKAIKERSKKQSNNKKLRKNFKKVDERKTISISDEVKTKLTAIKSQLKK